MDRILHHEHKLKSDQRKEHRGRLRAKPQEEPTAIQLGAEGRVVRALPMEKVYVGSQGRVSEAERSPFQPHQLEVRENPKQRVETGAAGKD